MAVRGAAVVRRSGLVATHQLAEEVEQREAQRARRRTALARLGAQHLQLHGLRARAHPRRYRRRPMARGAPRGHLARCGTRPARALRPVAGPTLVCRVVSTLAPLTPHRARS